MPSHFSSAAMQRLGIGEAEFQLDVLAVCFDGLAADAKFFRDLTSTVSSRDEREDGHLAIAKFPRKEDEINTVVWEAVALTLAKKAVINVADGRVETISNKPVLLLRRFDRDGGNRIPFLSAMSMLGAKDNESRSYLEFVDVLRRYGAAPMEDMMALWRRIVFTILISNIDDHLRNHRSSTRDKTAGVCRRRMT